MGWTYHSLESIPARYEIVGCKWPVDENPDEPGDEIRPVLVVKVIQRELDDGTRFASLLVCYGSKQATEEQLKRDLFIKNSECAAIRLKFPTRFSVDRSKEFIWGSKWFPPGRIKNSGMRFAGPLNAAQIERFKDCWRRYHKTEAPK